MKKIAGAIVLVLLVAIASSAATKVLWPTVDRVQLPAETDTVTLAPLDLGILWKDRIEPVWLETVTTDTVRVVDSVRVTDTVHVDRLPPRWYLDSASFAARGDTSLYSLTWFATDTTGQLLRRDAVESHVTLGPVKQIATDAEGLHVEYGDPPSSGIKLPFGIEVSTGTVCGVASGASFIGGLVVGG